jgi:hypothetical protein
LGRWTSADPLGLQAGLNLYLYGRASPVVMVDPNGMEPTPANVLDIRAKGEIRSWSRIKEQRAQLRTLSDAADASFQEQINQKWLEAQQSASAPPSPEATAFNEDPWSPEALKLFGVEPVVPYERGTFTGELRAAVAEGVGRFFNNPVESLLGLASAPGAAVPSVGFASFSATTHALEGMEAENDAVANYHYARASLGAAAVGGAILGTRLSAGGVALEAPAANPTLAVAAPTLAADIDLLALHGPKVPTRSAGMYNVVVHSDANSAWLLRNGEWIKVDHRALAKFIQKQPDYAGDPVRLVACDAGAASRGLAKNLANKLGVEVEAATDKVVIDSEGNFGTYGTWETFKPGR